MSVHVKMPLACVALALASVSCGAAPSDPPPNDPPPRDHIQENMEGGFTFLEQQVTFDNHVSGPGEADAYCHAEFPNHVFQVRCELWEGNATTWWLLNRSDDETLNNGGSAITTFAPCATLHFYQARNFHRARYADGSWSKWFLSTSTIYSGQATSRDDFVNCFR